MCDHEYKTLCITLGIEIEAYIVNSVKHNLCLKVKAIKSNNLCRHLVAKMQVCEM